MHRKCEYLTLGAKDIRLRAVSILMFGKYKELQRLRFTIWLRWLELRKAGMQMPNIKVMMGNRAVAEYSNGGFTSPSYQRRALNTALPPSGAPSPSPYATTA